MNLNCFVDKNKIVETVIQHLARSPQTFRSQIGEADEMYLYQWDELEDKNSDRALVYYYLLGRTILSSIQQIIESNFGSLEKVSSFLDFAGGYGRFTRFLIQEIAPEKIWVVDIYSDAVKFQAEHFGINGIVSSPEPEDLPIDRKFDCIYAGSFFSHMPATTFKRWMQKLYDLITPEGLLIFSVLDQDTMPTHIQMPSEGFLFFEQSESQSLDLAEYGTTYVTEFFIRDLIQEISDGKASVFRIKQGLCHYQDLYVVSLKSQNNLNEFKFVHHPEGYLDTCQITSSGDIELQGWALDFNPGGKIEAVQVIVQDKVIQQFQPTQERPDLVQHFKMPEALQSGWHCAISSSKINPEDTILIKTINTAGLEWIIEVGVLKSLMSRTRWQTKFSLTKNKLQETQAQFQHTQAMLAQSQAQLSQLEDTLGNTQAQLNSTQAALEQAENRIKAIESSKFWKLRTKWFTLKRAMGLPNNE